MDTTINDFVATSLEQDIEEFDRVQATNSRRREILTENVLAAASAVKINLGSPATPDREEEPADDPKMIMAKLAILKAAADLTEKQEASQNRRARLKLLQREQEQASNTGQVVAELLKKIGVQYTPSSTDDRPTFTEGDMQSDVKSLEDVVGPIAATELYTSPDEGIPKS